MTVQRFEPLAAALEHRRMPSDEFPDQPFTRSDLPELGLTPARLRRGLARQEVRRVLRGVFVSNGVPDSVDLRIRSVGRLVARGHVVCDRTAAWMHGVSVFDARSLDALPPVEICALRSRAATARADMRGRNRDLSPDDVEEIGGVLVTTPLRTALDLGCVLRRRDALAALDQFRARFGLTETDLSAASRRYFRRRGVVQLRELIPLSDPLSESVRESWTRLAILDAGLPAPVLQHEIAFDGCVWWRLDHAYPRQRVAVEYDGLEFHQTEEQVRHDERRRTWLRSDGWRLIVVRNGDFSGERLERWLRELRDALATPYTNLRW